MAAHDQVLFQFRLRLALLLALKYTLQFMIAGAFLWGTIVLALRALAGTPLPWLLWGVAGLPLALLAAILRVRKRLPKAADLRALVDRQNACGGLLMGSAERELGKWQGHMPDLGLPNVRWRGGRTWGLLAVAAGFVLFSFLVPQRFVNADADIPLEVGREVAKVAKQIEVLKEEAVLEPERADHLRDKLNQLREEASGKEPVKTLEALDHLSDVTSKAAKDFAESAVRKTEQTSKAETLAEALEKAAQALDEKTQAQAMEELARLTKEAAEASDLLKKLDPETAKALEKGSLTPEQLKKLAEALRDSKSALAAKLEKLREAGLIDLATLQQCEKCGQCDSEALAACLKSAGKGNKMSVAEMLAKCKEQRGNGGIGDGGPGKTPLTFGKESSEEGLKFKPRALPPAALQALKDSKMVGLSPDKPMVDDQAGPAGSGALEGAAAGGGSANTQTVLPRYRGTVERYFERPPSPSK
jgi:hypothetical protein